MRFWVSLDTFWRTGWRFSILCNLKGDSAEPEADSADSGSFKTAWELLVPFIVWLISFTNFEFDACSKTLIVERRMWEWIWFQSRQGGPDLTNKGKSCSIKTGSKPSLQRWKDIQTDRLTSTRLLGEGGTREDRAYLWRSVWILPHEDDGRAA